MRARWRFLAGFTMAPVASVVAAFLWIGVSILLKIGPADSPSSRPFLSEARELLLPIVVVAAGAELLFGLPAFLLLRARGRLSIRSTLLSGAVVGALPFAIFFAWLIGAGAWQALSPGFDGKHALDELLQVAPQGLWWLLLGSFCGAAGSCLFWLVIRNEAKSQGPSTHAVSAA